MIAHRHRPHPTELKIRLAESYLNGEGSLKGIAEAHDVSHNLLMIWVDKYRRGELSDKVDLVEKQRTYEAHIAALERKIGQLTMEVDALKKDSSGCRQPPTRCGSSPDPRSGVTGGCRVMSLSRSTYYKRPDEMKADLRRQSEAALRAAIENLVAD